MFNQKRFTINHSTWPRATAIALTLLLTMLIPNESLARQSTQAAPPGDAHANTFALPASPSPAAAGDEKWEDTFSVPGLGWGFVSALAADRNGNVYAGGYFSVAGGISAQNVAKWDGLRWSALSNGLEFQVNALVVDGNGVLYAGGYATAGTAGVHSYVSRWDGTTWSTIGDFTMWSWHGSPVIYALGVDGSNNVYVGGFFSQVGGLTTVVSHIARWNGTSWSNLGSGMGGGAVLALSVDSVGNVFAGGSFTGAGGVSGTGGVAYWNRSSWVSLDSGGPLARALAVDGAGNLFVASDNGISRWNGVAWSDVANVNGLHVSALAFDGSGRLHAGGEFTMMGGVSANGIARLDGATWSALGSGVDGRVDALAFDGGGNLYAGGSFGMAGGVITKNIARWSGSSWSGVGRGGSGGVDGDVRALALDGSGNLYVGGSFMRAGGAYGNYNTSANNIARWDGSRWFALGSGILDTVNAIAVSGSNVYVGGRFTTAGGVTVNNIARWDGQNWWPLGAGTDQPVLALAVDGNGRLYAGGTFRNAGGVAVDGLARWNGTAWEKLPSNNPFCPNHNCGVSVLTFDRSGNLYLAGGFEIGGSWRPVAQWDGFAFVATGSPPVGVVVALAVGPDGKLCAGGDGAYYATAGVACWDWISWSWSRLDPARKSPIKALAFDAGGNLYAGGVKVYDGDWSVARWDGSNWSPLGSDTSGHVSALLVDSSNRLYVGGSFNMAGPKLSSNIARYAPSGIPSSLLINHATGKPGSYFTLSGAGFPAGGTATVTVNGRVLTNALAVDSAGGVAFRLNTGQAGAGHYVATVSVNPSATVAFTLDPSTPLRAQQGSGPTYAVPSGIAFTKILYLPLIRR